MNEYLKKFIDYLKYQKNYSHYTVEGYEENIKLFLEFLNKKNKNLENTDYQELRTYLIFLYEKKYSKRTISRHISSLRSFFKYLLKEKIIQNNPTILLSNPKLDKVLPKFLYYDDLQILLNAPNNTLLGKRDKAILEVFYSTGIRVSEIINIKVNSIKDNAITILGKGNKERIVLFGKICDEKINDYLNERNSLAKVDNEYLFINHLGNKLTENGVRDIINKLLRKTSIKSKVSPHVLRHTFATHMLNEGADLVTVQELLGHENLKTTEVYTHVTNEHLRDVYLACHPRAKK